MVVVSDYDTLPLGTDTARAPGMAALAAPGGLLPIGEDDPAPAAASSGAAAAAGIQPLLHSGRPSAPQQPSDNSILAALRAEASGETTPMSVPTPSAASSLGPTQPGHSPHGTASHEEAVVLLSEDPLLSLIASRREQQLSAGSGGSGGSRRTARTTRSGGGMEVATMWELQWEALKIERPIGEGSFGKVREGGGRGGGLYRTPLLKPPAALA